MANLELPDELLDSLSKLADEQQITIPTLLNQLMAHNALGEQHFQAYMDNAPIVAYIKDANSNHLYRSRYLIDTVEQLQPGHKPKTPTSIFPEDVLEKITASDQKVLQVNDIVVLDDYVIEHDDQKTWYKEVKFPINGLDDNRYIGGFAIDITEQKDIEQQLRASEQFISEIADTCPGILYLFDIHENRNIYFNSRAGELLGYAPEEIQAMSSNVISALINPQDMPATYQHITRLQQANDNTILECTYRMRAKNGDWRWFTSWDKVAKRDKNGEVQQILGIALDITEKKRLETEQQMLLDRSPIPTSIATLDNKIEYFNDIFTETFGYTQEDIPDIATWMTRVYPNANYRKQVVDQWSADIQHALETNNLIPARNYNLTDKFGKERIVTIHGSIIGRRLFVTFIDVTEQHQMQETIAHSEAQYRSLFENSFHPIILFDADATILMINPIGANNLNDTEDNIIGRPLADFLPDQHDRTVKRIRHVMESGEIMYVDDEIQRHDKTLTFWSVLQPIVDKDNNIHSVQILSYDITEQRRAEKLQKKQEQLVVSLAKERQISQLRTRLLTTISHEFRTPLAIIQTNSEMLVRYNDRFSENQKEEKLNHVIAQIHHLVGMLDNVRTVSQSEHNMLPFAPETINLEMFLQQLASEFSHIQHPTQTLHIHSNIQHEIIRFDSNLMHQALINLLKNAVKYSPDNGQIHLHVSQPQKFLIIQIEDSGIGVPASDLAHIYQPFYRSENVVHLRGAGLGLAIVKKVVDLHRGTITCESQVNQGTTFTLQLPLNHK